MSTVTEELVNLMEIKKYVINSLNDVKLEKSAALHMRSLLSSLNDKINDLLLSKRLDEYLHSNEGK